MIIFRNHSSFECIEITLPNPSHDLSADEKHFIDELKTDRPTYIIIHGWVSSLNTSDFLPIMETIVKNNIGNSIGTIKSINIESI